MGIKRSLILLKKLNANDVCTITAQEVGRDLHYDVMYYLIDSDEVLLTLKYIRYMLQKALQQRYTKISESEISNYLSEIEPRYIIGPMYLYLHDDVQNLLHLKGLNELAHQIRKDYQRAKIVARDKVRQHKTAGAHKV